VYENINYETIKQRILSKIQGIDKREGSFVNDMVSPISTEFEGVYVELENILSTMFLEDISEEDLIKRCAEYGIYRKNGTYSEGIATFTGLENTVIPKDSLISTNTGLNFVTTEEKIIVTGTTTADIPIKSVEVGIVYNVEANTINTLSVGINGIIGVTNKEKLLGGTNVETIEELLNRLLLKLRTPATSGNKEHYKLWAIEVDGIGDAEIFPLAFGNGTVQVMPITTDKKAPDQTIITKVITKIEENRPIGATVTVTAPTEIKINIDAALEIDTNYSLQNIIDAYTEKITKYIQDSVPKIKTVDYFKALSLFYEIAGAKTVKNFKINNNTTNITIGPKEIQILGTINITV